MNKMISSTNWNHKREANRNSRSKEFNEWNEKCNGKFQKQIQQLQEDFKEFQRFDQVGETMWIKRQVIWNYPVRRKKEKKDEKVSKTYGI